VPFGALGIVEGALIGVIAGLVMAWVVSRRRRRSVGA
jgi:hypothetical protein